MKKPDDDIVFILGPTAVGKTAVSISLAQKIGGEVISCDAMQVYQQISIASNKPTSEEMRGVPHHLVDFVPLDEVFDVARFLKHAKAAMNEILSRNRRVIIAGGTGMYAKALLDGIFDIDAIPQDIKEELSREKCGKGLDFLYKELSSVDTLAASRIHPNDERRILRALEVYRFTGVPISELQKKTSGLWGQYPVAVFGLEMDRELLYDRINKRVEKMFEAGLMDELVRIKDVALSKTARAIIGLKEVGAYLNGQYSLEEAKEEMKKNTRHLAKRQLTWFKADKRIRWILMDEHEPIELITEKISREMNNA